MPTPAQIAERLDSAIRVFMQVLQDWGPAHPETRKAFDVAHRLAGEATTAGLTTPSHIHDLLKRGSGS